MLKYHFLCSAKLIFRRGSLTLECYFVAFDSDRLFVFLYWSSLEDIKIHIEPPTSWNMNAFITIKVKFKILKPLYTYKDIQSFSHSYRPEMAQNQIRTSNPFVYHAPAPTHLPSQHHLWSIAFHKKHLQRRFRSDIDCVYFDLMPGRQLIIYRRVLK